MNEILSTVIALVVLVAAFAGLVAWVRRDTFSTRTPDSDVDLDDPGRGLPEPRRASVVPGRRTQVLISAR